MDHINYAAVVTASAHIWAEAQGKDRLGSNSDIRETLEALYQRCLQSLQPLLADMGAREISNVLWSSATLGCDPDAAVPGMARALIDRFLQLVHASEEKQRPNAQECANLLLAFAKLGHQAATADVVNSVCLHFAHLVGSPTGKQQLNAQAVANVVWALGTLKHAPSDDRLLDHFCSYMHTLLQSQDERIAQTKSQLHCGVLHS